MTTAEQAFAFGTPDEPLLGILHAVDRQEPARGVVIIVGGPQYRVGSHRQFVLLGRDLAANGIPVLRFDHRGVGDSGGDPVGFEGLGDDLRKAIDELQARVPSVRSVCVWGLCDGASAALIHAPFDARVDRLVLLNPWVRTEGSLAQAYIDNYYRRRLRNPEFWRKMIANPAALWHATVGYIGNRRASTRAAEADAPVPDFLNRMLQGAQRFQGRVLLILSGSDTVAAEFDRLVADHPAWRQAFTRPGVATLRLPEATHTFSRRDWRDEVAASTAAFVHE
jgi:exosortase A-associated hydrolase 1